MCTSLRPTFKLGSVFLQSDEPDTKLLLMKRIGELLQFIILLGHS